MNYQLTAKDAPKIALALVLLIGVGIATASKSRQASAQSEQSQMIVQMNREMGMPTIDSSRPKEETTQEQDDQQEQLSAQVRASGLR